MKKILSIILCMAMVIAMTPSMVFAGTAYSEGDTVVVVIKKNDSWNRHYYGTAQACVDELINLVKEEGYGGKFSIYVAEGIAGDLKIPSGLWNDLTTVAWASSIGTLKEIGYLYRGDRGMVFELNRDEIESHKLENFKLFNGDELVWPKDAGDSENSYNPPELPQIAGAMDYDDLELGTYSENVSNVEDINTALASDAEDKNKVYVDVSKFENLDYDVTIDVGKGVLVLDKAADNVFITGAAARFSVPEASLSGDVAEIKEPAKPGVYVSTFTQEQIDALPDGTVITLFGLFLPESDETPILIQSDKKSHTVLDKGEFTNSAIDFAVAKNGSDEYFESVNAAVDAASTNVAINSISGANSITLLRDTTEQVMVAGDKAVTIDLNDHVIDGDLTAEGYVCINNTSGDANNPLGKGEIKGNLNYTHPSHINIKAGIFKENEALVDENSISSIIDGRWIVGEKTKVKKTLGLFLDYRIYAADAGVTEFKDKNNAILSRDSDDIPDLAANKEYQAVIYLNGFAGTKVRAFDFTAKLPADIMKDIEIKANPEVNKYTKATDLGEGLIRYSNATNNIDLDGDGSVPVAVINFKLDENKVKVKDEVLLTFENKYNVEETYVSTMETIHKIPFKSLDDYLGYVVNEKDGFKFYDYAYAPEGYKLAIIANEHPEGQTLTVEGAQDVWYTENPNYVQWSTNPKGETIGNRGKCGVYLAFVKESVAAKTEKEIYGLIGCDTESSRNELIYDPKPEQTNSYDEVDLDSSGKTDVNDASLAYQMLIGFKKSGTGSKWGYEPNDGYERIINTKQRLLAENDFNGKLYGTIEDVNCILNKALGTDVFFK